MTRTPTEEQTAIIEAVSGGETLKVEALAGTGKTSTLVMIAERYPRRRGLYLAYNAALKKEAIGKFPAWVDCKTVHGLAYREFGRRFSKQLALRGDSQTMVTNLDIETFAFTVDKERTLFTPFKMLAFAQDIVRRFTFSDRDAITEKDVNAFIHYDILKTCPCLALEPLPNKEDDLTQYLEAKSRNDGILEITSKLRDRLFVYASRLWREQQDPHNNHVPANHDTYLKLYQLSKPIIDDYDYILFDEAQDANPCILDILSYQYCQIIYVGDKYQQIYAFRGTINAMDRIDAQTLYLTQSFRFGHAIAEEANVILQKLSSPSPIKGLSSLESRVADVPTPYTFIARNNATLIQECIDKMLEGFKCCLLADTKSTVNLMRAVFFLWKDQVQFVKDDRVSSFQSWDILMAFAKLEADNELLGAINFILRNKDRTLEALSLLEKAGQYSEQEADIVLSTAHKSKGREWNNVSLSEEDFSLKDKHEMNLYYVAITRAKKILQHTFPKD